MDEEFELNEEDVISMPMSYNPIGQYFFNTEQLAGKVESQLGRSWFTQGIDGRLLRPGQPWIEGKVFLRVHFVPDNPELLEETEQHLLPPSNSYPNPEQNS